MKAPDSNIKPLLPLTSTERQCAITRAVLHDEPMRGAALLERICDAPITVEADAALSGAIADARKELGR